jgi:hypothetical protein
MERKAMPLSRRRKLKASSKSKNVIRGQQGGHNSLEFAREHARLSELADLSEWAAKSYWNKSPISGYLPRSIGRISSNQSLEHMGFERELHWAIGAFRAHSSRLTRYVAKRSEIDRHIHLGNFEEASELIDQVNVNVCWSLEALAKKIALVHEVEGLEAQKSWIRSHTAVSDSVTVRFFGYWFGVRSEQMSNPERFLTEIGSRISTIGEASNIEVYLAYQLACRPIQNGEESALLASMNCHSIIDQYEGCVHIAKQASCDMWPSSHLVYHLFLPFMKQVGDDRWKKISLLFGDLDRLSDFQLSPRQTDLSIAGGDPIEHQPNSSLEDEFEISQAISVSDLPFSPTSNSRRKTIEGLFSTGRTYKETKDELLRKSLLFPRTIVGEWCLAQTAIEDENPIEPNHHHHLQKFLTTDSLEPSIIPHIHNDIRTPYTERVQSQLQDDKLNQHVAYVYGVSQDADYGSQIPATFQAGAIFANAVASNDIPLAIKSAASLRVDFNKPSRASVQTEILGLLKFGQVKQAIDVAASLHEQDSTIIDWLPLEALANSLDDFTVGQISDQLSVAYVSWLLAEHFDPEFRSAQIFAIEGYLESRGLERPSELEHDEVSQSHQILAFLHTLCSVEALSLSMIYNDPQDLEEERMSILTMVKSVSAELSSECDDEIAQILREREVARALETLQRSKISLDETPLREWARANVSNKFERFRAYVDAGLIPVDELFQKNLMEALAAGVATSRKYEIPDNDAIALFIEIINDLSREFSLNAKHGLNCYLSLRIRHGTIAGQLRRPCEEQNLLTMVDSESGQYSSNKHWYRSMISESSSYNATAVAEVLGRFSQKYDTLIRSFADERVQIKSTEKPNGLIEYRFPDIIILGFASDAIDIETFDEFLDNFIVIYWLQLQRVFKETREYITSDLLASFTILFDDLTTQIEDETFGLNTPILNDALTRARTGVAECIVEMSSWFDVPQAVETSSLTISYLVQVGQEMVHRLHSNFSPDITISGESDFRLGNALILFTDIFFVLLGNVQKHSGTNSPTVGVDVSFGEEGVLEVTIVSSCTDLERHKLRIEAAQEKLRSGDYDHNVSREGGSGFYKLANLMRTSSAEDKLNFGMDEEGSSFFTKLRFSFTTIHSGSEGDENANIVD